MSRVTGRATAVGSLIVLAVLTLGAAVLSVTTAPRQVMHVAPSASVQRRWIPLPVHRSPPGWVPVAFGPAEISVPASWFVLRDGASACGSAAPGVLLLDWSGKAQWCPPGMGQSSPTITVVTLSRTNPPVPSASPNGTYTSTASTFLPSLGVGYSATGSATLLVIRTVGHSPRSNVLAPGSGPLTPASWKQVSFSGLSFSVPSRWPIDHLSTAPPCTDHTALSAPTGALTTRPPLALPCPAPPLTPQRPANGVEVDAWNGAYLGGRCLTRLQGGLTLCIDQSSSESILFVKVTEPGGRTVGVQIGLAGDGRVARTVLASLNG